jgi:hypothetical protein
MSPYLVSIKTADFVIDARAQEADDLVITVSFDSKLGRPVLMGLVPSPFLGDAEGFRKAALYAVWPVPSGGRLTEGFIVNINWKASPNGAWKPFLVYRQSSDKGLEQFHEPPDDGSHDFVSLDLACSRWASRCVCSAEAQARLADDLAQGVRKAEQDTAQIQGRDLTGELVSPHQPRPGNSA